MNRIEQRFEALSGKGERAFIPFIMAGDPTLEMTGKLIVEFDAAGADLIELGVPYSDPLADGVVNQEAAQRALLHDVSIKDILSLVRDVRAQTEVPLMLFTYYNPVLAYGVDDLARDGREAGIDGILCVDLPPEEAEEYRAAFASQGLSTVFLLAPTSTAERMAIVSEASTGFLYYVSRTGTTGEQKSVDASVAEMVRKIKDHTELPVCVGFGVSNPEQAAEVASLADGVVVGSAIVRMVGELGDSDAMPGQVGAFVRSLVEATKGRAQV